MVTTGYPPVILDGVTSLKDCCIVCQETLNCVGGSYNGFTCVVRTKTTTTASTVVNDMCPLGLLDTPTVFGTVEPGSERGEFRGPCQP